MNIPTIPPPLHDSSKGKYGISIGTSTALEGLFGVHDDIVYDKDNKQPYKRFNNVVFNLRTILRNLHASVKAEHQELFTPDAALYMLLEEMRIIHEVVVSTSKRKLRCFWYAELYDRKTLKAKYPEANIKDKRTPKQLDYDNLESEVFRILTEAIETGEIHEFVRISDKWFKFNISYNCKPKVKHLDYRVESSVIVTHLPVDLLELEITRLTLLESHTGKLKSEALFNTKLKGKPENMPFDIMTCQMFGESGNMFYPQPNTYRKALSEIAKSSGWNATTSRAKILDDCKRKGDPPLNSLIRKMYKKKGLLGILKR